MAKRTRKNARLSTNFKAETQAQQQPDAGADAAAQAAEKPAGTKAAPEADQPGGDAAAAAAAAANAAAAGAGDRKGADGSGSVRDGDGGSASGGGVADAGLKFRKRPVVFEAFQMTRERRADNSGWPGWLHEGWNKERDEAGAVFPSKPGSDATDELMIHTLEGDHLVSFDDWIIQGVTGELYPCKPDIFAELYVPDVDVDDSLMTDAEAAELHDAMHDSPPDPTPMTNAEKAVRAGVLAMFGTQHTLDLLVEAVEFDTPAIRSAGAFVLANRDAPAQAIAIELALKKLGGSMKPDAAEALGWSIFRHVTLAVHDHLAAIDAAAASAVPQVSAALPLDQAMQTQPGGFDAAGFSPRR